MARPIKETPILYGEDARVFEARMKNPPKESREKMEEINRDYNYIMSLFANWLWTDNKTGCRFITVDAYIEAIPFYLKNNFLELTKNDEDATHTRLLYYDLKMMSL